MNWTEHGPFTFFDVETTGMSPVKDKIVEIAAIRVEKDGCRKYFSSLVNPGFPVPPQSAAVHGITDEMLASAPKFESVAPKFLDFALETALIAHNAAFDLAFLQESLAREGFKTWNGKTIDSIKVLKKIFPGLPSYSLSYLREYFAVEPRNGQAHRAFADAECMMKIFSITMKQIQSHSTG
jgi:DNA polymerase III epsilon subunit family exonuclease